MLLGLNCSQNAVRVFLLQMHYKHLVCESDSAVEASRLFQSYMKLPAEIYWRLNDFIWVGEDERS